MAIYFELFGADCYLGIAADLKKALAFYSDAGGKGDPTILQEQAVQLMLEKLEVVSDTELAHAQNRVAITVIN